MEVGSAPVAFEHVRVIPVKVRVSDPHQGCDVLRGIGYRAVSSSGWEGPCRQARPDAVADMAEHKAAITHPRHTDEQR